MNRAILSALAAAALLVACGNTTKDVRSGRAWEDARPADYRAPMADVAKEVESYMQTLGYSIEYMEADKSYLRGYRAGTNVGEQNVELHVKIEGGTVEGTSRVRAISGRSLGVEWAGRHIHERLHEHLRSVFK